MARAFIFIFFLMLSGLSQSHHWVSESYDDSSLVYVEVVVKEFRFINPHPFVEVTLAEQADSDDVWTLEMDNRWELQALGFTDDTLRLGDQIRVAANPSPFDDRALYIRLIEHPRLGFRYVHNMRELYALDEAE